MNLHDKLFEAYASWSGARDELDRLRAQLPPPGSGQFAQSPKLAALFAAIATQQDICEARYAQLLDIADQHARLLRDRGQDGASPLTAGA
ncbi:MULTISPECIES: hypothetical protein [Ramlibacter]|uniref:Uncharacterized protein n=1 Tax=Ramlibacter pinisoli TaxID=2682844 RepID=A0A6N8IWX8_9BURK|nr:MULTISPECIES: hypothetical protein [Ramlibacter]MBA2965520.1 hypothetical protein [Ramlibacter sp. CGMCC 1.13660]MVQ30486.1 hypothetical protein [Ramlibacter pinisoli]